MKKISTTFLTSTLLISVFSSAVVPLNALADTKSQIQYAEPIYYDEINVNLTQQLSTTYSIKLNTAYSISEKNGIVLKPGSYVVMRSGTKIELFSGKTLIYKGESMNLYPTVYSLNSFITFSNSYSYLGDLKFTSNGSDGKIKVVNSLPTEHYLYGVVPYEMSESWAANGGLEALKAQAVAARSYVIARMNKEIVDTAKDQVYKGYSSSNKYSIKAVDQTKGVYITSNGKVISNALYSSTNGGYTLSVPNSWGGENFAYLQTKPDSYDTIVPSHKKWGFSIHKVQVASYSSLASNKNLSTIVERDSGSSVLEGIRNTIKSKAGIASTQNIKIFDITKLSFKVVNSSTKSTDRLMGNLQVVYGVYSKSQPTKYQVKTFSLSSRSYDFYLNKWLGTTSNFSNLRSPNVSSSSLSNGVYTVKGNGWGHGIGMSQWGAYQRAKDGKSYSQILKFYYDNTVLAPVKTSAVYKNQPTAPVLSYQATTFKNNTMTVAYSVNQPVTVNFYLGDKLIGSKNSPKGKNSIKIDAFDFAQGTYNLKVVLLNDKSKDLTTKVTVPYMPSISYESATFKNKALTINYSANRYTGINFYLDNKLVGSKKNTPIGKNSITMDVSSFSNGVHKLLIKTLDGKTKDITSSITIQSTTPAASTKTATKEVGKQVTHTVVRGDTLWGIGKKYGTSVDQIVKLNNLKSNTVFVGQVLKVTGNPIVQAITGTKVNAIKKGTITSKTATVNVQTTYTVAKGDTLWTISKIYGTSVDKIKKLNNLKSNTIRIGQVMKIK